MIFRRTIGLRDLVAAKGFEGVVIHLPSAGSEYDTLCGLDTTEPEMERVALPRGARATCPQCIAIWYGAKTIPGSFIDADALHATLGGQS